jgi:hypothetical protein
MNIQTASEWLRQGWLEGELPVLDHSTAQEFIERVGAHIYQAHLDGQWDYRTCESALESLNVLDDLWLGMPNVPEVQP